MNTISIVCLIATIVGYLLGKKFYKKYPLIIFAPGIFVPTIIIIVLVMSGVSYETYMLDAKWLIWMLGPATVAFALPIYEYRKLIQKHAFAICLGIIVGMLAGIVSSFYLAKLFQFDTATSYSLMARSISTPFAMELTSNIGGSVELVIVFTMITGTAGVMLGDMVLAGLKLKSHFAQGASLGNAAHGFGTSHAFSRHAEEGVAACLTMVLAGVFMVLAGPFLIRWTVALL